MGLCPLVHTGCALRFMCMSPLPASVRCATQKDLNPGIGRLARSIGVALVLL